MASELFEHQNVIDLNKKDKYGRAALHLVIRSGKASYQLFCQIYFVKGVDVNCRTNAGQTPLHHACQEDDVDDIAEMLIRDLKVDIDSNDKSGNTAFDVALEQKVGASSSKH